MNTVAQNLAKNIFLKTNNYFEEKMVQNINSITAAYEAVSRRKLLGGLAGGVGLATLPRLAFAKNKKLKIALSNSFIGNEWRIEMENLFKAALKMEPYASQVEGSYYNSGNNISQQIQQISFLIEEGVDAILLDASSSTGLNGIIQQAHERGILVVSFDNLVTAPSAVKVDISQYDFGAKLAEWLVQKLNGKGNVIMVTGVAGTMNDTQRNAAAEAVWAKYPDIKVVSRYTGQWDSAIAERNTASILPSLPKIDGIWCQAGTDGVLKAFIADGRPLPYTAGEADNGFRKFMVGYMGHTVQGLSVGDPPYTVLIALEMARQIINKTYPYTTKQIILPLPIVTNETVKIGETVFPDLPDSFDAAFTDSGPNASVKICVDAALHGTPCGGTLNIRLPKAI